MIIFTGKTKHYWMIFHLSLAHSYLRSYTTLFLLLPWKRLSSSSTLSAALQLLGTFLGFTHGSSSSQPLFSLLHHSEKPATTLGTLQGDLTAHSEFDAESTAHVEDTDQLSHMGVEDTASAYHIDFSAYKPPLQYSGLLSFPNKQHFVVKKW